MTIKAVIFDIDDTLCITEPICYEMETEIMRRMGCQMYSREVHIKTWGIIFDKAMQIRSPGIDFSEFIAVHEQVLKEFVDDGRIDVIAKHNLKALDDLLSDGRKVMLLTSRAESELGHMLKSDHILSSRVHEIYHKDNIKYHKPDPRAFDELLHDNNLLPDMCVYVGDSVGDAAAAIGAGMHFVATLESGIRSKSDFKDYDVLEFINTLPEIVDIVRGLK